MRGYVRRCNRRKRSECGVSKAENPAIVMGLFNQIEWFCDGFAAERSLALLVNCYKALWSLHEITLP